AREPNHNLFARMLTCSAPPAARAGNPPVQSVHASGTATSAITNARSTEPVFISHPPLESFRDDPLGHVPGHQTALGDCDEVKQGQPECGKHHDDAEAEIGPQ